MEYSPLWFQIFQKMKLMMLLIKWLVDYVILFCILFTNGATPDLTRLFNPIKIIIKFQSGK